MIIEKSARQYTNSRAAAFLARHLDDGRDYCHLLNDQRRGRRENCIPFQKDIKGRINYLEIDLLKFIDSERLRGVVPAPEFDIIKHDHDDLLMTPIEALRRLMAA